MTPGSDRISRRINIHLTGHHKPALATDIIPVIFTSEVTEPFAVTLTFPQPRDNVWWISRTILTDGMSVPAGEGDVQVFPDPDHPQWVEIVLDSPKGHAELRVNRDQLGLFLADSAHHQFTDIGPELDRWLTEVAA